MTEEKARDFMRQFWFTPDEAANLGYHGPEDPVSRGGVAGGTTASLPRPPSPPGSCPSRGAIPHSTWGGRPASSHVVPPPRKAPPDALLAPPPVPAPLPPMTMTRRLDEVEARLERLEVLEARLLERLDVVEARQGRLDVVVEHLEKVEPRLERLEAVAARLERLDVVEAGLERLNVVEAGLERLKVVEAGLERFKVVETRLEFLEKALEAGLQQVEKQLEDLQVAEMVTAAEAAGDG